MFSVLRGQIVEVKRKPDLLGRAVSATNYTHCAKFNLKILRITNYLEQAKIRHILQHATLSSTNSAAKLVFENDKSYQGISLSLPSLLGLHFLHEYGAFGLSIPSVSEIQEKYDRMKILNGPIAHCGYFLVWCCLHHDDHFDHDDHLDHYQF